MLRSSMLAAAAAIALVAAPAQAQVKWDLPSAYPADNFHSENLAAFARDVADVTAGKLAIKVYPNASLFPATAIKSAVRIGQAQVGEILISVHENEDPMFGIDVVPFLAASYDEARKLWLASKPAIERRLASQGLMVLFAVPWPPQGIYAKKEINTVADMQGLSWRVYNAGTERIAQIVGAYPVTIQAADLRQALATGLINAFMTSSATGYDTKAWETMSYFYDTQAWLPKNITFVNKAAFDGLDKPTQESLLKVAAAAEARGWWRSQDKTKWYGEQLMARGMKVLPPSAALKAGLHQVGERLTGEWLTRAGGDGQAVIDVYRKLGT
jgi:TRAP-type C4-dicarboxylate transport system substrate-binding protein